jgi:error-prone DNA polymerase
MQPPPAIPELVCRSAFSFHEGASRPAELVAQAAALGLGAVAITDRDGVYGLPRAHREALAQTEAGRPIRLICGALLTVTSGPGLALLVHDRTGWTNLCRLITLARCAGALPSGSGDTPHGRAGLEKGRGRVPLQDLLDRHDGLDAILLGGWADDDARAVQAAFGDRVSIALTRRLDSRDTDRLEQARALARRTGIPLLATHDVVMHAPERKPLLDVLTCIRRRCTLDRAGRSLHANAGRHLRGARATHALFSDDGPAMWRAVHVAERCRFQLTDLAYRYPREVVPEGWTPMAWLRKLTDDGLARRYPAGVPQTVRDTADHELALIERMDFPAYFLTVYDCVRFAQEQRILCQGRGSAANSVVCYALGVTAVDPTATQLLFERFLSEERGEPPDIDVDFEHERREEVIQYVYRKYGRDRAAMICNVITYRKRSALRDAGKALGLSDDQVDRLCKRIHWFDSGPVDDAQLRDAGLDPTDRRVRLALERADELRGFPRHLGLHSGGFTVSDGPLVDLIPVEPATMEGRTVIQWDKDDIDIVGFVKVDLLSLGMLTAIRKCFDLVGAWTGSPLDLATVPREDPATYDMLCKADSIGVFQIESRAQMSMLPRLKPRTWYDLVIEVSIVRPGPIQGGMVHPYLAARADPSKIRYAHPDLEPILARTAGVPIFQEQVMAMAVAVGGFTPGEADHLRRAMGAWRKRGGLEPLTKRLMAGMQERGIRPEYAERIAKQIQGFGEYGFPESHAASFAHLVYVSSWLKCHWPAAFTCALLNAQPMGFYSPRSLVADAQRHGVEVRPVCVQRSDWDSTLEHRDGRREAAGALVEDRAIRLGLRQIKGMAEDDARALVAARGDAPFRDIGDLARRTALRRDVLARLARADALAGLGIDRRTALWQVEGLLDLPLFRGLLRAEPDPALPTATPAEHLHEDFRAVGLSVDRDPVGMVRDQLRARGVQSAAQVLARPAGARVQAAGIVAHRQRPGTASGMLFMTMEDETGMLNLVVRPDLFERQRGVVLSHNLLEVVGTVQRDGDSISVLCHHFAPLDDAPAVPTRSRDFR